MYGANFSTSSDSFFSYGFENFTIIHQNIRSMRKNFDLLLNRINTLNFEPDLIFLTETWIFNNEAYLFEIPGYTLKTTCNDKMKAGGVEVFIRNFIIFTKCRVSRRKLSGSDMLRLGFSLNGKSFVIACFYRLHNAHRNYFFDDVENFLKAQICKNLVILGDMNIDISRRSAYVRNYLGLMSHFELESYINEPTRITRIRQSCIDHIFGRLDSFSVSSGVVDLGISDHCMTSLSFCV